MTRVTCALALLALLLTAHEAMARDDLRVEFVELGSKQTLRSVARAPEESALVGCAIVWLTESNDFPAAGELSLACYEKGSLTRRPLAAGEETLRDLRVETGPEGVLRVLLAHEDRIEERLLASREAELSAPRLVFSGTGLTRGALAVRPDFDEDGTDDLQLDTWRGVEAWIRRGAGYEKLAEARLPPRATMSRFGPDMTVSGWDFVADDELGTRWTTPETRPGNRLSTWRVPLEGSGFGEPCEAWVATSEALQVQTVRFQALGERELLVAITQPAEKFSLFGEGTLIVAEPRCDETRRGRPPILVAKTSYAPWFPPRIRELRDVTGDGIEDIVLAGFSGKLNVNAEVRVHAGLRGGGFSPRPLRWEEDADARGLTWDTDLDGDGYEDLVLQDSGKLAIYRGVAPRAGRVPLANQPSWRARLPRKWDASWTASWQVDAGGRHVVLAFLSHEDDERSAFVLVEIPPATD